MTKSKYKIGDKVYVKPIDYPEVKGKVVGFQKISPFLPIVEGKIKGGSPFKNAFDLELIRPMSKRALKKKSMIMQWVSAESELPENLHRVYLKIHWKRKLIRDVGFYSTERKEFFAAGGTFKPKFVQWLKNDVNQTFPVKYGTKKSRTKNKRSRTTQ